MASMEWLPFRRKELPQPVKSIYTEARETYRAWNSVEGGDSAIIDYNLSGSTSHERKSKQYAHTTPRRTRIEEDLNKVAEAMGSIAPPEEEKHNWNFLRAQLLASQAYLQRLRSKNIPLKDYIEKTMQVTFEALPEGILESLRDGSEGLLEKARILGISPLDQQGLNRFRLERAIPREEAVQRLISNGREARGRVGRFIGETFTFNFEVIPVDKPEYWWVWADTDLVTGAFRFQQNFSGQRAKTWTEGKTEELGAHEVAVHHARMDLRRRQIQRGELSKVFGMTTVHGPEAVVEEGLGLTIAHFVPGMYESFSPEGQFQVDASILRALAYGNLHFKLSENPAMKTKAAIDYIRNYIPWESKDEIERQMHERIEDPLLSTYLYAYSAGAIRFLAYTKTLSPDGRRNFLREIYCKPYTIKQAHQLYETLINNPKYRGGDLTRGIWTTPEENAPAGNMNIVTT